MPLETVHHLLKDNTTKFIRANVPIDAGKIVNSRDTLSRQLLACTFTFSHKCLGKSRIQSAAYRSVFVQVERLQDPILNRVITLA